MKTMKELMKTFPHTGTIEWIGIREEKGSELEERNSVIVDTSQGIQGDHYHGKSGNRHVTLIQKEHIAVVEGIVKKPVHPGELRRNLVVSGINLTSLKDEHIRIGDEVILEVTGICAPCSRMEQNLGEGGYNAMRGHGGITARVIQSGTIKTKDAVIHHTV